MIWTGLEELRAELRRLPAELAAEGSEIVLDAAEAAKTEVVQAYPPGDIRNGVFVRHQSAGQFGAGAVLVNPSKIAWLYDNGSQARHYITKGGAVHATGAMWGKRPPKHVFVKAVIKHRRAMYTRLQDLLTRHGLTVSGDPNA